MLRLVILFLLFIFSRLGLMAQCDPSVVPSSNHQLAYKTRGNRCEGFFVAKVAANRIRVVSFTLGDVRFEPSESEVIDIQSPEPNLTLQAMGIPNDLYYRMDLELKEKKMEWPVKDVLYQDERTRIARNIGILAYKQNGNSRTYFPVSIQGKKVTNAPANPTPILKIICTTRIAIVQWRVKGEANYRTLPGTSFRAYTPIYIRIPADLKGNHELEVRVREENSTEWPRPLLLNVNL